MSENSDSLKSDMVLAEIQKRKDRQKSDSAEEQKTGLVIFTLGKDYYAFSDADVTEILPYQEITFVPGCPDSFLGIINVRGDIESVINIHKIFGIAEKKTERETRIVIAACGDIRSGILVDSVNDIIGVPQNALKPPLSIIDPSVREFAIAGEMLYDQKYVTVLDVKKIFSKLQLSVARNQP